jgi:alkylation response protein AidB-like acyl-CoA dehydrogenase
MTQTSNEPLEEAARLAETFRQDAAERDGVAGTPRHERDLLRDSGLLRLSIPTELGGLGGDWSTLLRAACLK